MAVRTGKVIIAKNIKLDKSYKDVLDYTESEMFSLVNTNKVAESTNCSFIKVGENVIDTNFSYGDALKCNYMAMQNPLYSNKWFFAFIDSVEYISDGNARIHYTIDEFSTWFDYWNPKTCFVVREHVTNDTVGLHTVPENLELGDYVGNSGDFEEYRFTDYVYLINSSTLATKNGDEVQKGNLYTPLGGISVAGNIYVCPTVGVLAQVLQLFSNNGLSDNINNVWLVPKVLITNYNESLLHWNGQTTYYSEEVELIEKPTDLDGYVPKNKKLLTFPYCYCVMSNNNGSSNILKYELFSGNTGTITYIGIPSIGGSIFAYPKNYDKQGLSAENGLMAGKFPTLSWSEDSYTNWLTQNAVNLGIGVAQDTLQIVGGIGMIASGGGAVAGAGMLASAGVSIASQVSQVYQHSLNPITAKGNINGGDILTASGFNSFCYYHMCIKQEYAKICDDYLSRMGYKVNTLKVPNQTGRPYWNYVQIGLEENIGYSTVEGVSVPASSMDIINNIYRRGVTIWHNHVHIGNYALDNSLH